MTEAAMPRWAFAALVAAMGAATVGALAAGSGNPFVAAAPVLAGSAVWAVTRLPLRQTLSVLLLAVLAIDNPQERPAAGEWKSPLYPIGSLLFENLSKVTGVDALRFALIDLLLVGLVALALLRGSGERNGAERPPKVLTVSLLVALAGLAAGLAWGFVRGGDLKGALWQVRQLVAFPVLGLLFLSAFREPRHFAALGKIVVGAAAFRTLEGAYFYEVICRPRDFKPPYVTTHSDTMLFALAILLLVVFWNEARTRKSFWAMVLGGLWLLLGIYLNGRRLAYVTLGASAFAVFLLAPWTRLKRAVARVALASIPVALLYVAVGWNASGGVFRPAQTVKSILVSSADRSTQTRDIENFNLAMTLKSNPLLGTGFGHEYLELSRADDISRLFPQYRLIPHNSLLGLWAFAGLFGFWLLFLPVVVAIFLAVRAYRLAPTPLTRTLALSPVLMAIAYLLQAYGDMGLQSWGGAFLLAAALAAPGLLAVRTGAWPTQQ
ncbi:MAG TPA: O-antigen ligase family protein [Myxococcales bacterium]